MRSLNWLTRRCDAALPWVERRAPARWVACALVFAGASAGYAHTDNPDKIVNALGRAAGFEVRYLTMDGNEETSTSAIIASLGLDPAGSLLGLDVADTRARLEALPWVTAATVRKIYPDTLQMEFSEADAFARWRSGGETRLIARDGRVLAEPVPAAFAALPMVVGAGADARAQEGVSLLSAVPLDASNAVAAILVNRRRWDVRLANGATVKLPEEGVLAALDRLATMEAEGALLATGPVVVDLRLADRTTLRLSPPGDNALDGAEPSALASGPSWDDPLAAAIAESQLAARGRLASAADDDLATLIGEVSR